MTKEEYFKFVHDNRNDIKNCPICHQSIKDRKIALYKELIDALYRVYVWCGKNKRHEFEMKDIRNALGKNEYARFGDLVRFGGIIYRPVSEQKRKAKYGLNMERAKSFFAGQYKIPIQIVLDQMENRIVSATYVTIKDFPKLKSLLTSEGLYDHEKEVGENQYRVQGASEKIYTVTLSPLMDKCTCEAYIYGKGRKMCKHVLDIRKKVEEERQIELRKIQTTLI